MSRKRNFNRKSMAILHSVIQRPRNEQFEIEYYRPGCYCIPQAIPNVTPYSCAYLQEYVPQWTAACNTATYVVDMYGMVYYLSDFEHQMQFSNNDVDTEISYRIPTYVEDNDCDVPTEEDEGEAVSPRKRERLEDDTNEAEQGLVVDLQYKAQTLGQEYFVEEPADTENIVDKSDMQKGN